MDGTHKKEEILRKKSLILRIRKRHLNFLISHIIKKEDFNPTKVYHEQEGHEKGSRHPIRPTFVNGFRNGSDSISKSRNVVKGYKI